MRWSGFTGGPGYTNLYFLNPEEPTLAIRNTTATRVKAWFDALKVMMPSVVTIQFPTEMDEIDTATGDLTNTLPIDTIANAVGTQVGTYSAPTGACVNWATGQIVNGRRLRGRTFLVPLAGSIFQSDGTLNDANRTTMVTASTTLCSFQDNLVLAIWHRPTTPGGTDGVAAQVSSASVTDKAAVLRSRRD